MELLGGVPVPRRPDPEGLGKGGRRRLALGLSIKWAYSRDNNLKSRAAERQRQDPWAGCWSGQSIAAAAPPEARGDGTPWAAPAPMRGGCLSVYTNYVGIICICK